MKLTNDERVILKNIDKDYKWIAREKEGSLILYYDKPCKYEVNGFWKNKIWDEEFNMYKHLFKMIKWSDEEPTLIEELLGVEE